MPAKAIVSVEAFPGIDRFFGAMGPSYRSHPHPASQYDFGSPSTFSAM
jgi:hypothetical protein